LPAQAGFYVHHIYNDKCTAMTPVLAWHVESLPVKNFAPSVAIYPITIDGVVIDQCGIECPRGTVSMAHETLYPTVAAFKADFPDDETEGGLLR
jgi:hypothetical protein